MNEETIISQKKPRCHSMMVENQSKSLKEQNEIWCYEEELEESEMKPEKILDPFLKPKDHLLLWQSNEKDRICLLFLIL